MQLVVESGATKSTWVILDQNTVVDHQVLLGINPTSNPKSLEVIKGYNPELGHSVDSICYYGAGVSAVEARTLLRSCLEEHFGPVSLYIGSDIMAAARSVSANQSSIVSILGTGMNSVVFDGHEIIYSQRSLGYLFGDYGSGFYIGKLIIQTYYSGRMNTTDGLLFKTHYLDNQEDLIFRLYNSNKPNYETAQLSRFLNICSKQLRQDILHTSFIHFFENQVLTIDNHKSYPLNFVGSISKIFELELRAAARDYNLQIDKVVGNPIDGLVDYHRNNDK